MRKVLFCSLIVLLLFYSDCYSQKQTDYFSCIIDSLDKIQPKALPKEKPLGRAHIIKVRNQHQFDCINDQIIASINEGRTNIVVNIGPGVFCFQENHISLNKLEKKDVTITIKGKNTIITSDNDFSNEVYYISPWTELDQADGLIEVVDKEKKRCFIPFKNSIKEDSVLPYDKVQITQWFKAPTYAIEKIDQEGIYFIAPELAFVKQFGREEYSVNYDYIYAGIIPRFRLFDKREERKCSASCFIKISSSSLRSFTLQGIKFKENNVDAPLITINSLNVSKISIQNCIFDYIRGKVMDVSNSINVLFDRNVVTNSNGRELTFSNGCKNVQVTHNRFEKCGIGLGNTLCVRCNESEYYIGYNTFCNFGYCAIGVGLWYGHEKKHDIRGIIEHNEIYFTDDYFAHRKKYTLMDAGAIYVWTQNDDAIIRYNYIHDYGGMRFNSGIYCDDGASNCKIYGNVILNTPDGCSITSRKVKDQKASLKNNSNNFLAGNVVDGSVVFAGYGDEERHCVKGANYVVKGEKAVNNKIEYVEKQDKDIEIERVQEVKKFKNFKFKIKNK